MGRALFMLLLLGIASNGLGQISAKKSASSGEIPWYSSIEIRHHINTYYDDDGFLLSQEPSLHARAQIGARLYEGLIDTYATLGVYKIPQTQQIMQRRPELAMDVYAVRNRYFTLLQYNLIRMPFEEREQDPDSDSTGSDAGTAYTIGITPKAQFPVTLGSTTMFIKAGLDTWTKLYSRPQYTDNYSSESEGRVGDDLALAPEIEEEKEDFALHYFGSTMIGVDLQNLMGSDLSTGVNVTYHSAFEPKYTETESGTDYKYQPDRYSYYKWRLKYSFSERVSFVNDFYHFHDGLFAGKRNGSEDRRYRNIARITCKL